MTPNQVVKKLSAKYCRKARSAQTVMIAMGVTIPGDDNFANYAMNQVHKDLEQALKIAEFIDFSQDFRDALDMDVFQ